MKRPLHFAKLCYHILLNFRELLFKILHQLQNLNHFQIQPSTMHHVGGCDPLGLVWRRELSE